MQSGHSARQGLALIVVVGVLGVLSVLAVAFVTMAQLERKASQQRVYAARAYLLAKSGIEDALARLGMGQDSQASGNRYGGEDWNGDGALNGVETANEVYRPGVLDVDDCPVRYAMRPSFFAGDGTGLPKFRPVDGKLRGFSGTLMGDQVDDGNQYVLKVSSQGGFYLNGGDPSVKTVPGSPPTPPTNYNDVLKRILGTLADAIDREPDGVTPKGNLTQADGWTLIDQRPQAGWTSFDQVRDVALGGSQAKLDALQPYLTLHAWVDKHVIAPNANAGMVNTPYHSWGEIKLAHTANPSNAANHAPDFERIPVSPPGKIVGRAPVDFAWARTRRPALIALIAGLKGVYLDGTTQAVWAPPGGGGTGAKAILPNSNTLGTLRPAEIVNTWSAGDDCHLIANAILTSTSPLATWQQWNQFCDSLAPVLPPVDPNWIPGEIMASDLKSRRPMWTSDLFHAKLDLLKANFNPHSDLNKFNPNSILWKSVDKSDLLVHSTEFSLLPSLQGQEVTCVGRVLSSSGRLLASRTLKASVGGLSVVRLSTQKEFVCDSLGDLDTPGGESNPRLPGFAVGGVPAYLTQGKFTDPVHKTWGHTLNTTGSLPAVNYGSSWMNGSSQGAGLQAYPEPYYDAGGGLSINPADYDGNLQLATVDTPANYPYGATGMDPVTRAPVQNMMMLARFEDGFNLDLPATGPSSVCVTDTLMVPKDKLGTGLLQETSPGSGIINTLYPDGAYSEGGRTPAYYDNGNSAPYHGLISFWVKPGILMYTPNIDNGRIWVSDANIDNNTDTVPGVDTNQAFYIGLYYGASVLIPNCPYFGFESSHQGKDVDNLLSETRAFGCWRRDYAVNPHQWLLMTAYWDANAPVASQADMVAVNAGPSTLDNYASYANSDWSAVSPPSADDKRYGLTGTWPHLLGLGPLNPRDLYEAGIYVPFGADATLDEFAIYDFGGAVGNGPKIAPTPADAGTTLSAAGTLASGRYQQGRYYKGWRYNPGRIAASPTDMANEAGCYFTGPVSLPAGATIRKIAWTWHRPANLPTDYAEVALVNPGCTDYVWTSDLSRSSRALGWDPLHPDRQDWDVNRALPPGSSSFRAQVLFCRKDDLGSSTPIIESPVFDDLTILYYQAVGGVKMVSWGDGQ